MADVAENLRAKLTGTAAIAAIVGDRVHQSHVPESSDTPYIWFMRSRASEPETLGGDVTIGLEQQFDLECIADDLDDSQDLAAQVKTAIHNYRGTLGTQTVNGVFVTEHTDEYIPRGISSDQVAFVSALQVTIFQR